MRPCFWQRRVRCLALSPLEKSRGWSTEWRTSLAVAAFPFEECGRLSALHRSVLRGPVRAFGEGAQWAPTVSELLAGHPSVPGRSSALPERGGYVVPRPRAPHRRPPLPGAGLEGSLCLISGTFPSRSSIIATSREDALDEPGTVEYRPKMGLKSRGV
jgi:hypothetical protein